MSDDLEDEDVPDYVDNCGNTPLHRAVTNPREDFLRELSREVNVNVKNEDEKTPLHVAVNSSSANQHFFVSRLLDRGADVNAQDIWGQTPLHYLVQSRDFNEVQRNLCTLLLNKGANVTLQTILTERSIRVGGETPLHIAIDFNTEYVPLLLASTSGKEAINIPSDRGETPLMYAVTRDSLDMVKLCLQNGADVMLKNECGMTPLHYATQKSNLDIINELLQSGAEINCVDNTGATPFFYADDSDVLDFLCMRAADVKVSDAVELRTEYIDMMICEGMEFQSLTKKIGTLMDWGFYPTLNTHPVDVSAAYIYGEARARFFIRSTLVNLHNNNTIYIARDYIDRSSYLDSCREEVDRMKLERFGNHSLYDVFGQYDDPTYICNEDLKSAVESNTLKCRFPIYKSLLKATYKNALKRIHLLDVVVDNFQIPLPREVKRYILSFLDNDSLKGFL